MEINEKQISKKGTNGFKNERSHLLWGQQARLKFVEEYKQKNLQNI